VIRDLRFVDAGEGWIDPAAGETLQQESRARAASFLAFVERTAEAAGVPCETIVATDNQPFDAIVNAANERGCDLIVMTGRCRTALGSVIMRSGATRVLHRSSIPVLTFRAIMSADHPDEVRSAQPQKAEGLTA
jgi:nucleotide-binding universal stress UspA family protein